MSNVVSVMATMKLRLYVPEGGNMREPILQQAFETVDLKSGTVGLRWQAVPIVYDYGDGKEPR